MRGSNALTGGVDDVLELERPRSDSLSGEGVRVLQAVSRFSATPDELVVALTEDGYEARGDALTATAEVEQRRILAALEALGEADYKTLSEDTDLPRTTVRTARNPERARRRDWTVAELVGRYLTQHQAAPATIARLTYMTNKATEAFGDVRLRELLPDEIGAGRSGSRRGTGTMRWSPSGRS